MEAPGDVQTLISAEDISSTQTGHSRQPGEWTAPWPQTAAEFENLIDAFQDRLVRYAYRRIGNFQEAEDVAQEVFVKAFMLRSRMKDVTSVGAYLYRMAANECTDCGRKRKVA